MSICTGKKQILLCCFYSFPYFSPTQHPELCKFPSQTFYGGELRTGESTAYHVDQPLSLWPKPNCPHVLVHVEGEERVLTVSTEEGNEMSRSNDAEVDKVVSERTKHFQKCRRESRSLIRYS